MNVEDKPLEAWVMNRTSADNSPDPEIFAEIHARLGKPDAVKRFLASLLASLFHSQQLAARLLAESRIEKKS